MNLPPRRLPLRDWPAEVVNRIRQELSNPYEIPMEAQNNVGVYWYEGKELVLANFNREPARCVIRRPGIALDPRFTHRPDTRLEKQTAGAVVTVPSWELAVLRWK